MTEIPENVLCLFSAELKEQHGSYIIEVPEQEIAAGDIDIDEIYRVALLSPGTLTADNREPEQESLAPPVEEGELRSVVIEDIGDKGDGIARVERGYVVIIPDTEQDEQVTVKIIEVRENVAFAEVLKREERSRS